MPRLLAVAVLVWAGCVPAADMVDGAGDWLLSPASAASAATLVPGVLQGARRRSASPTA